MGRIKSDLLEYFVLILYYFVPQKKNFVPYAISEKTMALLASYEASRTKAKNNQNGKNKADSLSAKFVLFCTIQKKIKMLILTPKNNPYFN